LRKYFARNAVPLLTLLVASVWLIHGLYNKLLHGSTRHLAIVQSVPWFGGSTGEHTLMAVGLLETGIGLWVLVGSAPRLCAAVQTVLLPTMNVVELTFARHLLLWPAGLLPLNLAFLALAWTVALSGERGRLFAWLRRHPLPVDAHLRDCITLTYAVPAPVLRRLLPPGLELETVAGFGFIAVAVVEAESLRPSGLPKACGQDFFLAGYRLFARFRLPNGGSIRGLRILRSDTDRWPMVLGGNLLTHYNYHRCDAAVDATPRRIRVSVRTPDGGGDLDVTADPATQTLPAGSPFSSVRDARRFAGPLPFTFDYERETHSIIAIRATRTNWRPVPIAVDVGRIAFFDRPEFAGCTPVLAAAFHVKAIDYRWERGVRYALPSPEGALRQPRAGHA
jgi:uncharacterized membrane protein YphA (DoxX/SURF4 family)